MTLPDERYRAVKNARQFLRDLMDPKKTPRVPRAIRLQARSVLKHYPADYDMDLAAFTLPKVFEKPEEAKPAKKERCGICFAGRSGDCCS